MRDTPKAGRLRAVALLTLFLVAGVPLLSAVGSAEATDTITVIGRGEVYAEPDQATITVGVQLYDESAQDASVLLRERMEAVIGAIRALGIPDRQIQTTNYSIFFERDYQAPAASRAGERRPAGIYRVENMVRVSLDDPTLAARTVEAAIEAGANQLYGISFSISDPGLVDAQARELAMNDALARATQLATLAGRTVGRAIGISEVLGSSPAYAEARSMGGYGGGPVEPGATRYAAGVQVTYELE